MYEVVTVATHKEGKLDELINNELNIPVTVLGMGKKWTGFKMKYELMYEHIQSMDDNKIIIFLDGFDSNIVGHPSNAIQKFKEKNYKLLFSKDNVTYVRAFGTCKDNITLNSGMYMGYVKYLKPFYKYNLSQTCKDDQRTANQSCKHFDFISIDTTSEILQNNQILFLPNQKLNPNAVFVSYPGAVPSINRGVRALYTFGQFELKKMFLLFLIFMALCVYMKSYTAIIVVTIVFLNYFSKIDRSCM
jgi:hypothetical protein